MNPKRIVGFMALAQQIVKQTPGLKAQEVYARAKDMAKIQNRNLSAARSPQGSLVATLHKHYRHYGLTRERAGREYLYYTADAGVAPVSAKPTVMRSNGDGLTLSVQLDKQIEALVNLGRFRNKQEAQRELIAIGLQTVLDKLR